MDVSLFTIIAIALSAVVLLIQLITLAQIAGTQKAIRELKEIKAAVPPAPQTNRFERKDNDFRRHEKRPFQQDQRPPRSQQHNQAPSPAPSVAPVAAVDPVETSLRDINLRLKNAERDQEFARKKIQENLGNRDQHPRGNDRGDHGNDRYREGGERNRDRGGRDRGGRDRNRNPRHDNWQDRNRQMPPQTTPSAAPVAAPSASEEPSFERDVPVSAPPTIPAPVQQMAAVTAPAIETAVFAPQATDRAPATEGSSTDEGFEHGRKVIVKRRPLSAENVPVSPETASEESSIDAPTGVETEIQFGRRKGL